MAKKKAQLFVWNGFPFTEPQPGRNSQFPREAALLAAEVVKDFPKGLPCCISFEAPFKKIIISCLLCIRHLLYASDSQMRGAISPPVVDIRLETSSLVTAGVGGVTGI